jgi:hypothetical protein
MQPICQALRELLPVPMVMWRFIKYFMFLAGCPPVVSRDPMQIV